MQILSYVYSSTLRYNDIFTESIIIIIIGISIKFLLGQWLCTKSWCIGWMLSQLLQPLSQVPNKILFSVIYIQISQNSCSPHAADILFVVFPINYLHLWINSILSSRPHDNVPKATLTTDTISMILHFKFWHFLFENLILLTLHLIIDSLLLLLLLLLLKL